MIGSDLGPYRILAKLGEGGMGEVYRARDPRLDREVAIKVLPASLATDAASLARFEREAMSIAKLSHPNILAIHEFGRHEGIVYVVTELVTGETLRARLQHGPLPARRALAYAVQIARGMAAAHARGIIHRDLKPDNVMITADDQVRILDFGLAKPIDVPDTEMTRAGVRTSAGTVLGTFGYMAPEQVRGLALDHRADIFAFGALLYEMLSGERAFAGATAADTMTAVLTKDPPDLDTARLAISPGLDRIVRRCLEKAPDLRFQSANDLTFALETLTHLSSTSSGAQDLRALPATAQRAGMRWLSWGVAALAMLVAAALWFARGAANTPETRWSTFTRVTERAGEETAPTLSPDGNTVAYAVRMNGSWGIYSQRVGGRNATPIVDDPQRDEAGPAFSPDGSLIAFHKSDAVGGIFVAGATGESVRRLTDAGFDPAWSPDGKQIAFATEEIFDPAARQTDSALFVVDVAGGAPRKLLEPDAVQPAWSPAGARIAYWSSVGGQRDIYTIPSGGGAPVAVTKDAAIDWSPVWSPDGRFIYFSSDRGGAGNLWRVAVNESSGQVLGTPEPVSAGVQASAGLPRFSKDGSRLAFKSRVASINPVAIPFDPLTTRAGMPVLLDTQNNFRIPSDVSPDGQIAYYSIGEHQEDLFIGPPRGPIRRVTDDPARDRAPVFTPDGRSILFYSNRDGSWAGWIVGIDGGGLRKIAAPAEGVIYPQISPKGDVIVFTGVSGRAVFTASLGSAPGNVAALPNIVTNGLYFTPTGWSADGAHLTGTLVSEGGRPSGVGVYDLASHTTTAISDDQTYAAKWLADGRRIAYFTDNGRRLVIVDRVTRKRIAVEVQLPAPSIGEMFAISPDNRTIYYGAARAEADIWIVERK